VHGGRVSGVHGDSNLSVVNAGEVAGAGRLVLLRLEREGVRVHTRRRGASVMVVRLDRVEVLTGLLLETVLAVKDKLEGVEGTVGILAVTLGGTRRTEGKERGTRARGDRHVAVGLGDRHGVGLEDDAVDLVLGGEVPEGGTSGGVGESPHELLDGVVVREADLLGLTGGDGIGTSVLDLLDKVLMTLLGESATLLGVKVDVVGPDLEGIGVAVGVEIGREVNVHPDLVVLQSNERQIKPRISVEKEEEGEENLLVGNAGGHLGVSSLLRLIVVEGIVHAPPLLVLLVDALTTDGQLNVVDGTLGDPVAVIGSVVGRGVGGEGLELDVHVTDKITVAGNSHGDAARVGGGTVDGLLDVLHSEVSVALVNRLEESYLRVASQVDILGTVSDELHKTTGHFESICTIYREKNLRRMRNFRYRFFSVQYKCRLALMMKNPLMRLKKEKL
jgi:hypothetical protein